MSTKKLNLSYLYNRLDTLETQFLFFKYPFFIIYNTLNNQKQLYNLKDTKQIKLQFFLKTITKKFVFSSFFQSKVVKYPLTIQLLKTTEYFEKFIIAFFLSKKNFLQIKYQNCLFVLKSEQTHFFQKMFSQLKEIYNYGNLGFEFLLLI